MGAAIAAVLADRPERVAIDASGGWPHASGAYNNGGIDQPLDRWILGRLERNDHAALKQLFTLDADNLRAGTGEVRAWISVAAAMKRAAQVMECVPAHCTLTGRGFAFWPAVERRAVAEAERSLAQAR